MNPRKFLIEVLGLLGKLIRFIIVIYEGKTNLSSSVRSFLAYSLLVLYYHGGHDSGGAMHMHVHF